jgi:hypothetical protein
MADIDPEEAKAKLETYLGLQDRWHRSDSAFFDLECQFRKGEPETLDKLRAGYSQASDLRDMVRDALLHDGDEIARLVARVGITGFNQAIPEATLGRDAVKRAIGQCARWRETGVDPRPALAPLECATTPHSSVKSAGGPKADNDIGGTSHRALAWCALILTTITRLGGTVVGKKWGETRTCEVNIQRDCKARDGRAGAQVCKLDGASWSDCEGFMSRADGNLVSQQPAP